MRSQTILVGMFLCLRGWLVVCHLHHRLPLAVSLSQRIATKRKRLGGFILSHGQASLHRLAGTRPFTRLIVVLRQRYSFDTLRIAGKSKRHFPQHVTPFYALALAHCAPLGRGCAPGSVSNAGEWDFVAHACTVSLRAIFVPTVSRRSRRTCTGQPPSRNDDWYRVTYRIVTSAQTVNH